MAEEAVADANTELAENKCEASVEELISRRAYELFEQRGSIHGHDAEDWLQAEAEVKELLAGKNAETQK